MARITTAFGARSTAGEVARGIDLSGKRIIVTGASSGIGIETARALARTGAEVTLAVRNIAAGEDAARDIVASSGNRNVRVVFLDLSDRGSIASFVSAWDGPLHVLVNNAGVMATPEQYTPEGWELQFAINHLGHFALSAGLHDALALGAPARIVSVSSSAHMLSPVIFDDVHFAFRRYEPLPAYGQSKTANVLFAVEASQRWAGDGITVNALHPGGIRTQLQRYVSEEELDRLRAATGSRQPNWKTPEQGAATSTMLAASPLIEGVSGRYFEDCNEAGPNQPGTRTGVAAHALDPEAAARLWDVSEAYLAS